MSVAGFDNSVPSVWYSYTAWEQFLRLGQSEGDAQLSRAGVLSDRGDYYQLLIAEHWLIRLLRGPREISFAQVQSTGLPPLPKSPRASEWRRLPILSATPRLCIRLRMMLCMRPSATGGIKSDPSRATQDPASDPSDAPIAIDLHAH